MLMSDTELEEIKPDYIILDEFHRCGAEMWGKGVENLLNKYPDIPVLGLSATAIRYLNNRRDMSDELFDGNIASEMTLGEAIVRGILNSPKYVTALYSYQKDFEKYEYRLRHAQSKIVRDAGEKYLAALKRAIEKADGLDEVFKKHIKNKSGKYIVFCANFNHMNEMADKAKEWFAKVDTEPHIYKAYSNDPATSKAFSAFKADVSKHLKLLYSIDMLNEGIHVDDIDGVILLRPTVSPFIYKQQIGRALCAGSNKNAVIFDIVDNISGLYSVGAIEEEIKDAVDFYNYRGESSYIVNDKFKIIDEVADCKRLFDELDRTLSASWDFMYGEAEKYYRKNGNLLPPQTYVTEDGYKLGQWVVTQRTNHTKNDPALTKDRIAKLDKIGMIWELEDSWNTKFQSAKQYYYENGNLNVPADYVTNDGITLGRWLRTVKNNYTLGVLPEEKKKQFESIGMVWSKNESKWYQGYSYASEYFTKNNNLNIPQDYVTDDGYKLGEWLGSQRQQCRNGKLDVERQERLENIGAYFQ